MRDIEADLVGRAYAACGYHQGEAARHLKVSYDQMRHLLKKHGLGRTPK